MVELEPVPTKDELLELHRHQAATWKATAWWMSGDMTRFDAERLKQLIEQHLRYTNSDVARLILDNWQDILPKFVKVMPVDYRRALKEMQAQEAAGDMPHRREGG
jgi:glutamate synthase (NADPH/NADH) large chain